MVSIYLIIFFTFISSTSKSQETLIKWEDKKGRKFEITAPSGYFSYGIITGDRIEYGSKYSDNPGKVIKIGDVYIEYDGSFSDNPGKVIKVGEVRIEYGGKYSDNPGKLIKVGGLRINYSSKYSDIPGVIESIEGRVLNY